MQVNITDLVIWQYFHTSEFWSKSPNSRYFKYCSLPIWDRSKVKLWSYVWRQWHAGDVIPDAWNLPSLKIHFPSNFIHWQILKNPKSISFKLTAGTNFFTKIKKTIDLNNVLLSFTNLYILKKKLKKSTSFSSTTDNSRNWRKNFFRAVTSLMFSEIMRNWGCNFLWIFHIYVFDYVEFSEFNNWFWLSLN